MDSRKIVKAAKRSPVSTRKITIKKVISLPEEDKDLYNPFSPLPPSNEKTKIYDPFELSESDDEKSSPDHNNCNPEPPEEVGNIVNKEDKPADPIEKTDDQTPAANAIADQAPTVEMNKKQINETGGGNTKSTSSASSQSKKQWDMFEDLDLVIDDNHESVAEASNENSKKEKNSVKHQDLPKESNSRKHSISASGVNLETTPQSDHVEMQVFSNEISSTQRKHKKHSKQHGDDSILSKRDNKKSLEGKTLKKEQSHSRHREKKAKHSKKDKKDKDTRKSINSNVAEQITKQYDIDVIEQDEEEGEIVDEPKIVEKRKSTETMKEQNLENRIVESDREVIESPKHEKKGRKDSTTEESRFKHKKNKRKSLDFEDETLIIKDERKHEKNAEKRKSDSCESKDVEGRKKHKSDRVSDREKSVEYRRSGHNKRRSTNSDRESDSHYRDKASTDKDGYRNSYRESRHRETKTKIERDYWSERKSKNESYEYGETHRRPSRNDERDGKERVSCHENKRKDKYHEGERRERRSKHRYDDFDDGSNSRKSPSTERPHKRRSDSRASKSSDRELHKRKREVTSSVERDSSHKMHSSHKSMTSEVTWKSKERRRTISWRSIDEDIHDAEIDKNRVQYRSGHKEAKDTHSDKYRDFEYDEKSKKRTISRAEESPEDGAMEGFVKRSSHSKKSKRKHKHTKSKPSCSPSSIEDFNKYDKKSSKHRKKKKKRRSSVESANSSRHASETKTGDGSRISTDEFFLENDAKTEPNNDILCREDVPKSSAQCPIEAFYEELDLINSASSLPNSDHEEVNKKDADLPASEVAVDENFTAFPLDVSTSPSKDLPSGSPLRNDVATPTLYEASSRSPVLGGKGDVKPHHNIKESLSFAEEFVERSRKRWKEKKSSIASSNDSPQLCVLSDSESKSNHRNLAETEEDTLKNSESNGNSEVTATIKIPGLSISESPVGDTDFRLHDTDARYRDVEIDIFEDSHQSAGTPHHSVDNGGSIGADNSFGKLVSGSQEDYEPEMTPADMVLDSESSDNAKIVDVEERLDSSQLSGNDNEKTSLDTKKENAPSTNNGEKALLNPTQILNSIGLNPQQHSAAQNAILSIAELSKHLHLDKFSDHLIKKTQQAKSNTPVEIESSAVELHNRDKERGHLKKLKFQEQVIEEAKSAIKPYYESREISKTEYKDILKKAVNKIYSSETTHEVNTVKIRRLIRRYIEKYQQKKSMKKDKSKSKVSKSPLAPQYQPLVSTSEVKASMSYPLPFSKREPKKTYTLPDLPLPPPPPPPKP